MQKINRDDISTIFDALDATMTKNRNRLIEMDRQYGDSDLGLTMSRAFTAAAEFVRQNRDGDIANIVMRAGMTIARTAPSTMGTLMATGFMRGGKALENSHTVTTVEAARFGRAFADGLIERGKARPGEKTVIDSILPAAEALEKAANENASLDTAIASALAAAEQGLENTKSMLPCHGKAACFGEKTLGSPDAGAMVGVLLLASVNALVNGKLSDEQST
jgi:dihydroxyacetone kinase-like protein